MKNIMYFIALIFSSSIYGQSGIENDELFLEYERRYFEIIGTNDGAKYEEAYQNFYSYFKDAKKLESFEKNKNKERWLQKNATIIGFNSSEEAIKSYNKQLQLKEDLDKVNNEMLALGQKLLQKYDREVIWETLKSRLSKKEDI